MRFTVAANWAETWATPSATSSTRRLAELWWGGGVVVLGLGDGCRRVACVSPDLAAGMGMGAGRTRPWLRGGFRTTVSST